MPAGVPDGIDLDMVIATAERHAPDVIAEELHDRHGHADSPGVQDEKDRRGVGR